MSLAKFPLDPARCLVGFTDLVESSNTRVTSDTSFNEADCGGFKAKEGMA